MGQFNGDISSGEGDIDDTSSQARENSVHSLTKDNDSQSSAKENDDKEDDDEETTTAELSRIMETLNLEDKSAVEKLVRHIIRSTKSVSIDEFIRRFVEGRSMSKLLLEQQETIDRKHSQLNHEYHDLFKQWTDL